jgi:MFS family permease
VRRHTVTRGNGNWQFGLHLNDPVLWSFIAAMVLIHVTNAQSGAYLGLDIKQDLGSLARYLSNAFVIRMVAWLAVVSPAGFLADRFGRRPLRVGGWSVMTIRLALLAPLGRSVVPQEAARALGVARHVSNQGAVHRGDRGVGRKNGDWITLPACWKP